MKSVEFTSLIRPRGQQIRWPACELAEERWGRFLLNHFMAGNHLTPIKNPVLDYVTDVVRQGVVLQKTTRDQAHTLLVIDPFPGLLLTDSGHAMRPLLQIPRVNLVDEQRLYSDFRSSLDVKEHDPLWYVSGMSMLLSEVVVGGIDSIGFVETLKEYQQYLSEKSF